MTEQFEKQISRLKMVLNIELPCSLLDQIVVVFKDNDQNNWSTDNVSYRFKNVSLECPFYPGYYYIPGFSRYVIDLTGELRVVRTGFRKKWSTTSSGKRGITGGYKVSHGVCDTGQRKGISRHRALCLAFKSYYRHPSELVVNHINGVPGDDRLDNLELCTPGENIKHAYDNDLFSHKTVAVDAWNWKTGEIFSFPTIQKCADHIKSTHEFITGRLKAGNNKRFDDGWRFKRRDELWLPLNARVGEMVTNVDILARDIFTGKTWIFGSIADASRHTGILGGSVRKQAEDQPLIPLNGWNFRYLDGFDGWPQYTEKHLAIFKDRPVKSGDGIEVYDLDKNEMLFFTSCEKAGMYFNISPVTAGKLARYEGTRAGRFKFKLFKVRETSGPLVK